MGSFLIAITGGLAVLIIWYYLARYLPQQPWDRWRRWQAHRREVRRLKKETPEQRAARESQERLQDFLDIDSNDD